MDNKEAKKILTETVKDYNSICDKYSSVRSSAWKELEFLFKNIKKDDIVLDLGCGNGRFYEFIKVKGYIGIDPSSKLIGICKKKYPDVEFIIGDANNMPFDNKLFDNIFSIAVLHHIPGQFQKTFLNEARRVLKDDGILTLTVWNLKEKAKGKKEVYLPWYGTKGTYFYSFDLEELIKLVSDAGFRVIESGEILVGKKPYSNFYIIAEK